MVQKTGLTLLPDNRARITALTEHDRTLLVEAGAGSGKTALMAGRVAMLIAADIHPKNIVAITFTEAAASELLERIERFVQALFIGEIPTELTSALPAGLSDHQLENIQRHKQNLDEITCTTIHGFCKQIITPYPVETGQDPGAKITDPAAAGMAFQELTTEWLSEKFGRERVVPDPGKKLPKDGLDDDFLMELIRKNPDRTIALIQQVGGFLNGHRTAEAPKSSSGSFTAFRKAVESFQAWYKKCGVPEPDTAELLEDLLRVATLTDRLNEKQTGKIVVELLFHERPTACLKGDFAFKQWRKKGKWQLAAAASGLKKKDGEPLSDAGESFYQKCGEAYESFCSSLGEIAFQCFVKEFDGLKNRYRDYKRSAALLDFDDLLHNARDLLKSNEKVQQYLGEKYSRILVDEFQDTDPLQAEILWLLAGEGVESLPWSKREIRPGALFLVGDPKQAIYRFRGADLGTYLTAKKALLEHDKNAAIEITANFRSQASILGFVNTHFESILDESQGQPGFTDLQSVRPDENEPSVQAFEIQLDNDHRNANGSLNVESVRLEEARIVARIAQRLIGSYPVWDRKSGSYRSANAGDIALLAPVGTSLWIYEQEMESLGIPISTQAGKGFFGRQETQDMIAIARAIADTRDTLAFGALIRGPIVGLTEEEIADEIHQLNEIPDGRAYLNLWTDPEKVKNPILQHTLKVLQKIAKNKRRSIPYLLMAAAVEELHIRPKLKARHLQGSERALANIELVLEMARSYNVRGMSDFSRMLTESWQNEDRQVEGRPDEDEHSVKIITMHSSKGLEWPIVIPINSTSTPDSDQGLIYRGEDDTVHFKVFGYPNREYDEALRQESLEIGRERIRLWYVALTRARDLLLLPHQSERTDGDWLGLLNLEIDKLPVLDLEKFKGVPPLPPSGIQNTQDVATWEKEDAFIASTQWKISWHQPSRHEGDLEPGEETTEIFVSPDSLIEIVPSTFDEPGIQGGMARGSILHKLMEEVLTGETEDDTGTIQARASELIIQFGCKDEEDSSKGLSSREMAVTVKRTFELDEIRELRPRLIPEFGVYSGQVDGQKVSLSAGIADAITLNEAGTIDTVIDWKSDLDPDPSQVQKYHCQVREYLKSTGASNGLIVFMSSGRIETVQTW